METYNRAALAAEGIHDEFVQDNHSRSEAIGTVRGLHFQTPPFAQAKLVRCSAGRILDVAVDIRAGSSTFGHFVSVELSEDNGWQLYVPIGFAHGFATLEAACEVQYKVAAPYSAQNEGGIIWNDPAIGIDWQIDTASAVLSEKDTKLPPFADFETPFRYQQNS